jgi:hypothetical protein
MVSIPKAGKLAPFRFEIKIKTARQRLAAVVVT